jgi:LacI family repressor for deo operon, udp, cdd, tsx, nupC, and nupG
MGKSTTILDVAARLNVSHGTVWKALHNQGRVSQETRKRVLEVSKEMGYQPSMVGQMLVNQKTKLLGVVVPMIGNTSFSPMVQGVERVARKNGYNIILCDTDLDLDVEREYFDLLHSRRVEGVVFVPGSQLNHNTETLAAFEDHGNPVVVINQNPIFKSFTAVTSDVLSATRDMTRHLVRLGHRRIAFFHIGMPQDEMSTQERLVGYRSGLEAEGIAYDESLIFQAGKITMNDDDSYQAESVIAFLSRSDRPTAILAHTDMLAIRVMRTVVGMGLGIPKDIALVGFDDILMTSHILPALTTVHQPMEEIGKRAAELIFQRLTNTLPAGVPWPIHERIPCQLKIRESCGAGLSRNNSHNS